ncbi:MAG: hypothetical protein SynsKO_19480 [Synoicihabitans sp.]
MAPQWGKPAVSEVLFWDFDPAHELFAMDLVAKGAVPWRDFFWHYGPLPLQMAAKLASVCGDLLVGWRWYFWGWGTLCILLVYAVTRRVFGPSLVAASIALLAVAMQVGGAGRLPIGMEIAALFSLALMWRPPVERSFRSLWLVGALMGVMQSIKFGGAFFAGLAWLLTDLVHLFGTKKFRDTWRSWFMQNFSILAGFLILQGALALWAYAKAGGAAMEFLWPAYHLSWYDSYVEETGIRWPEFVSVNFFLTYQWPLVLGFFGGACAAWGICRRWRRMASNRATVMKGRESLVFLWLFFVLGCLAYFSQGNNIMTYGGLLLPCIGICWTLLPSRLWRWLMVASLLPAIIILPVNVMRGIQGTSREPLIQDRTPAGIELWMTEHEWNLVAELEELLGPLKNPDGPPPTVLVPDALGSGYYLHHQVLPAMRVTWFGRPNAIPAHEVPQSLAATLRSDALIFRGVSAETMEHDIDELRRIFARRLPFEFDLSIEIMQRFGSPRRSPAGWLVFYPETTSQSE